MTELSDLLIGKILENTYTNMEREKIERKPFLEVMPDKETLEEFMKGLVGGENNVVFNAETGRFEWIIDRPIIWLNK